MPAPPLTFAPVAGCSRTGLDRAGVRLRDWWNTHDAPVTDQIISDWQTMLMFRETFQAPLNKTVNGLRSMVCSEMPALKETGGRIPVVQRLKRSEQMLSKLSRFPDSKLSNMADIGGCRAVLDTREQVDGVVKRIRKNWHLHGRIRDTRDVPAPSGYRAVHVVVIRAGRRIEVQLRTPHEQAWAVSVERTGARLGIPLKEGEGPADLRRYFQLASQGMYLDSVGEQPDPDFLVEVQAARARVIDRYF